jgi:hypothetical protein
MTNRERKVALDSMYLQTNSAGSQHVARLIIARSVPCCTTKVGNSNHPSSKQIPFAALDASNRPKTKILTTTGSRYFCFDINPNRTPHAVVYRTGRPIVGMPQNPRTRQPQLRHGAVRDKDIAGPSVAKQLKHLFCVHKMHRCDIGMGICPQLPIIAMKVAGAMRAGAIL